MHIPDTGWTRGSWKGKRDQFGLLGRMIGLSDRPSSGELQEALKRVASAKVFAESVDDFVAATGKSKSEVVNELEHINKKLGTMEPVPFRSMLQGQVDPTSFNGVAIWPAGTVSWMQLRWDQIKLAEEAGARFEHIIVLGSSRICNAAADRRHPYIRKVFREGTEPTEIELMKHWVYVSDKLDRQYVIPEPPESSDGRPLPLQSTLGWLRHTEYWELIADRPVYVPANPNALYVPLHVRRVLGLDDVWFSQGGARLQRQTPDWWWPAVQDLMTTPSGILRLWIELEAAGCLTSN